MFQFNFEIVVIIILCFGVYYLFEQNKLLQLQIKRYQEIEKDTNDTLDFMNKDLMQLKQSLMESKKPRPVVQPSVQRQQEVQPPVQAPVELPAQVEPPQVEQSEQSNVIIPEIRITPPEANIQNTLTNILGRLPRGTIQRTSSFSMNIPPNLGESRGDSTNIKSI